MDKRNVILITADSLRADYCGWLNDERSTTPFLDEISEDSIVFENAIASGPRTPSSAPVMISGAHFGVSEQPFSGRGERVSHHMHRNGTVAEQFKEEDYTTIAFTVNPWTFGDAGFNQGFDRFVEVGNNKGGRFPEIFEDTLLETPAKYVDYWLHDKSMFCTWHTFYDRVSEAVSEVEEPYFLWVFLLDTHNPFLVPHSDRSESNLLSMYYSFLRGNKVLNQSGRSTLNVDMPKHVLTRLKKSYRDTIRSTDRFVKVLWNEVKTDDPVLVFNSDHGEAFKEHGTFGHQQVLYEENIRVPLLVHNAGLTGTVSQPFGFDALPNLLTTCGYGELGDIEELGSEFVFSRTEDETHTAVRGHEWKLISNQDGDELYHMSEDPLEQESLVEEETQQLSRLREFRSEFLDGLDRVKGKGGKESDSETQELLKSLGYLDE